MGRLCNPSLFKALKHVFRDVRVLRQGIVGDYERVISNKVINGVSRTFSNIRLKANGQRGETYNINCPFCGDTKHRMHIPHFFGKQDKQTRSRYLNVWVCFNEQCQSDFNNSLSLWEDVEVYITLNGGGFLTEEYSVEEYDNNRSIDDSKIIPTSRPGICIPLTDIPKGTKEFAVIDYLEIERNFNHKILNDYYGVEYLHTPYFYKCLKGRIWTPFYRHNEMIAWTARAVPSLCDSDIKHFHSPGGLGGLLYGLGTAITSNVLILVEGTADRWAAGNSSVAILGKKLHTEKQIRLFSALNNSSVRVILVCLDPTRSADDIAKNREHHIESTVSRIRQYWSGTVLPCYLPGDKDPADLGGFELSKVIYKVLSENGYEELGALSAREMCRSTATRQ